MTKDWSISDPNKGARAIQDIISCHIKPKSRKFNCAYPPLFQTVPIDHVVTDVLFDLLIMDVRRQDANEKSTHHHHNAKSNLTILEFLNTTCKIPFHFQLAIIPRN